MKAIQEPTTIKVISDRQESQRFMANWRACYSFDTEWFKADTMFTNVDEAVGYFRRMVGQGYAPQGKYTLVFDGFSFADGKTREKTITCKHYPQYEGYDEGQPRYITGMPSFKFPTKESRNQ
jgi:hypothetical protein